MEKISYCTEAEWSSLQHCKHRRTKSYTRDTRVYSGAGSEPTVQYGGQRSHNRSTISSTVAHSVAETPLHEGNPSSPHPSQIFHGRKRPQTSLRWEATHISWWWIIFLSRFPEDQQLRSTTSRSVISALKGIFGRHGVPETLMSDNGPQYVSVEFTEFARAYGFCHTTSSPHYPHANGLAERTVKTIKGLFKESSNQPLALLSYRTTPLPWCGLSPAELCFGRPLRTDIPRTKDSLTPGWPYLEKFRDDDESFKRRQKRDYDKRHRTHSVSELPAGTGVWINTDGRNTEGVANPSLSAPRSYTVTTANGTVRRNRSHLNVVPDSTQTPLTSGQEPSMTGPPTQRMILTHSRTRTPVIPPDRL